MTPQAAERELLWYFTQFESSVGIKSNFGIMLERLSEQPNVEDYPEPTNPMSVKAQPIIVWTDKYTKGLLRAIARARNVRTRLAKLTTQQREALHWSIALGAPIPDTWKPGDLGTAQDLYTAALALYCKD